MWANTVWGLLGLAASCALTLVGLSPDSEWRGYLLAGAALFLIGSIVCLSWPLRDPERRCKVRDGCKIAVTRTAAAVEANLVLIGLAILLLGAAVIGYASYKQSAEMSDLRSTFDVVKKGLADSKQPGKPATRLGRMEADPPKPEPKKYTAYEREQRLRAVDEIYSVLATQLQPTCSEGRKLIYEIYRTVDGSAEQRLTDYANKVQAAFDSLNALLKKYIYFTDIVQATTKNTFNDVAATHGVKNLVPEIVALRSKAPNDIQWFLLRNTTMLDAINQIGAFERYLNETIPRLQEKRAEIEKAAVYSGQ